jgi:hypothetical protein
MRIPSSRVDGLGYSLSMSNFYSNFEMISLLCENLRTNSSSKRISQKKGSDISCGELSPRLNPLVVTRFPQARSFTMAAGFHSALFRKTFFFSLLREVFSLLVLANRTVSSPTSLYPPIQNSLFQTKILSFKKGMTKAGLHFSANVVKKSEGRMTDLHHGHVGYFGHTKLDSP